MNIFDKELIEERINSVVDKSRVVNYCIGYSYKTAKFVGLAGFFALLGIFISSLFAFLSVFILIGGIMYVIISSKKYILVFLDESFLLIMIEKERELNIIDSYFYKYQDINGGTVMERKFGNPRTSIGFKSNLLINVNPNPYNSSFNLKDFNIERFILDQKLKEKNKKDDAKINDLDTIKENVEEMKNQNLEERSKKKSQKLIDLILAEKDKGIITNEEFLQKEKETIEKIRLGLIQQDSYISYDVYLKLASTKRATVERLLETINKDELIVLHHTKIKSITNEMWNSIVSEGISENYEIIYKCGL
jgi:hypothetical protein